MTKLKAMAFLISVGVSLVAASGITIASDETGNWRQYSQEPNGDIHFYDTTRVEMIASQYRVWTRIRYKTSVMGASSYQSLLAIDCTERTQQILQNTFFSDKHWENPAMQPDKTPKPARVIPHDSASERLFEVLCD